MGCVEVISRLRLEPFLFLYMLATALEGLTITQMAQDKICLYKYGQDIDVCAKLSEQVSTDSVDDVKNLILSDVTTFTLYKTLISTLPVIFWSLFLGAWADRHERAPKFLMSIVAIASCIETTLLIFNAIYFELDVNWMLISFIPQGISSGLLGIMMSVFSHVASTTEVEFRTIKFAIIEAILFVAVPIGIFIGGDIIGTIIEGDDGQLHRYVRVYGIALGCQILASFWIVFVPLEKSIYKNKETICEANDENENKCETESEEREENDKIEVAEEFINSNEERQPLIRKEVIKTTGQEIKYIETVLQLSLSQQESNFRKNSSDVKQNSGQTHPSTNGVQLADEVHWYVMFKDLIDFQNVRDTWETCTKERDDGKRGEIWVLIISMMIISLTNNGATGILFQFVQRVFEWNAQTFSIVNASTLLIISLSVVIIVPTLIKVFHFSNMSLSIVGILSIYLQNLIRGTLLNPEAFYVSYAIGSMAYVPAISVRSKLSTIVEQTEENKVFGLLATLETITPFIGSVLYSTLFSATIATYPGLVFHFSTALLLVPFIGFVYIANYCE